MENYFEEIIKKVLEWKHNNELCKVPTHMINKYDQIKPTTKETLIGDLIDFDKKYKQNLTMRQLIINRINQIYTKSSGSKLNLDISDNDLILLFEKLLKGLYQQ